MKEHTNPEGKRLPTRDLVTVALLTGLLWGAKFAMSWLPNIEPVSLLLLLYTLHYKRKTLYIIYAFALLEMVLYGAGSVVYLYIWTIWYAAVRLLRHTSSSLFWALLSGAFGLSFGALCSIPYLFLGGPSAMLGYFIAGIPFDISHCIGNFLLTLALFPLLDRQFSRLRL